MMLKTNIESFETVKRIPENSVGVELGVWKAESSEKFLQKAKFLHLVDTWSPYIFEGDNEFGGYETYLNRYSKMVGSNKPEDFVKYYNNIYNLVCEKMKDKPVKIHRCSTTEFFKNFNEKVDWVYIDASHKFEDCLLDLHNSLKIVKKGGSIFGDDYGSKLGVVQAVSKFIKDTKLNFCNFYRNQYEIKL